MTVEDQASILEVENRGEGAGVEILVGCRVILRREGCEAGAKVSFESLKGSETHCRTFQRSGQLAD